MTLKTVHFVLLAITAASFSLTAMAKEQQWPDVTEDGLQRVQDSKLAVVYVEPGADLSTYSRVNISKPTVAFKKNWERDQRSRSASKLSTSSRVNTKKIKQELADEFEMVFTEKLESGGYKVVDEVADDVLLVRPSIVNLDIAAPEVQGGGRSTAKIRSAGEMTMYIELYDSVTGDLLAKAVDRKEDRPETEGMYTWATKYSNEAAARRILDGWAQILLDALNEAKTQPVIPAQ